MPKVLMVSSEAAPYCKTGGLADVVGSLPVALREQGAEVAVVLPGYLDLKTPDPPREVWRHLPVPIGPHVFQTDIYRTDRQGVAFFIVDCPALYGRHGIYGDAKGDFSDNHLRYGVLCLAALGVIRHLFRPQVIHCHDWQASLLPVYLRTIFANSPEFLGMKTLLTIHNLGYQGRFWSGLLGDLGLDPALMHPAGLEFYGDINFLKGGIAFSDAINTVSPTYAREIQTAEYGFGLDGFLRTRSGAISGILNGADYSQWNPETDPYIARNYSSSDLSGKVECKRALLDEMGLPERMDRPLLGIVSRFADQKGFDLVEQIAGQLAGEDAALVVLGSGDPHFENSFRKLAGAHPDKFSVRVGYDEGLSHRIEAGADMFLMPSRYEPCGLNQIYSLRYGTVPIVRATGGLDDTIEGGTGFKFWDYSAHSFFLAIRAALEAFQDRPGWRETMRRCMEKDFSWEASAGQYLDFYRRILER
ncbi:MAG TPA: glycogen synthase GlgA [Bryobacteraceae bacterium]|nr:glycogen synthase GlgA [Bryobacteraceae bacterium]